MTENRQIIIDSLPEDKLAQSNYALRPVPLAEPGDDQVLCQTLANCIAAGTRAGLLVNRRLRMEGFLLFDFIDRYEQARAELR